MYDDTALQRLGRVIGAIWELEVDELPLAEIRFGDPGEDYTGLLERKEGVAKMTILPRESVSECLKTALHEVRHGIKYGTAEEVCDAYSRVYFDRWYGPVLAYVETGDPSQINAVLAAEQDRRARAKAKREAEPYIKQAEGLLWRARADRDRVRSYKSGGRLTNADLRWANEVMNIVGGVSKSCDGNRVVKRWLKAQLEPVNALLFA